MTKRKTNEPRALKPDEKILWNLVTRTVSPIRSRQTREKKDLSFSEPLDDTTAQPKKSSPITTAGSRPSKHINSPMPTILQSAQKQATKPIEITPFIDKPVYRKIARGKLLIDAQIDLHDLTQEQAIIRLKNFLFQASKMGHRHILVITGKGGSPTSEGVLRRMLPYWLNGADLSAIVNGYQSASRSHGGDGAFYVRLRRIK